MPRTYLKTLCSAITLLSCLAAAPPSPAPDANMPNSQGSSRGGISMLFASLTQGGAVIANGTTMAVTGGIVGASQGGPYQLVAGPVPGLAQNLEPSEPPDSPEPDTTGLQKTRFISFSIPASAENSETALRVVLFSLHHVSPPYTGGPSVPFMEFEGQVRWVGPPVQYVESSASQIPFNASALQCVPHYQDWSAVGLLHVTGSAIVPSSSYEVDNVAASCMGIEETCAAVSAPLVVSTTRWGDVEVPYNPPDATAQPNASDIGALVNKFRGALGAPIKARALLTGADQFGNISIAADFSFIHIASCVDAFRGLPYPFTIQACP